MQLAFDLDLLRANDEGYVRGLPPGWKKIQEFIGDAQATAAPEPQPPVVTADATKSKSGKLSEELRPGNLRKIIEILESGKTLTPNDISKKYGRPLTKLKHDVRRSKIEQKDDILKLLNTIKRI